MAWIKNRVVNWIILSVLFIGVTGGYIGYRMYTKPHRSVADAKATTVDAVKIATAYETNETEANSQYLDKILEVKGEVTEVTKNQKGETVIALKGTDMSGVRCTIEGAAPQDIKNGTSLTLKGICTGYLTDVVMVRCVVQSK
jgi:tRNA_anti-like